MKKHKFCKYCERDVDACCDCIANTGECCECFEDHLADQEYYNSHDWTISAFESMGDCP